MPAGEGKAGEGRAGEDPMMTAERQSDLRYSSSAPGQFRSIGFGFGQKQTKNRQTLYHHEKNS